jgi:hypothetical protein
MLGLRLLHLSVKILKVSLNLYSRLLLSSGTAVRLRAIKLSIGYLLQRLNH